jgi:PAS domain S-box-containing protein
MYRGEKADESVIGNAKKTILTAALNVADDEKKKLADELIIAREEKAELAEELITANNEKGQREAELVIANKEKSELADELVVAEEEKAKRAAELAIANKEKAKREAELLIANEEKSERAAELVIANKEKGKRAAELVIANEEKGKRAAELVIANADKAKRAAELVIANAEKAKNAAVLVVANLEKANRADELILADKEIIYQNEEKLKLAAELVIADVNKTKREAELVIANIEKTKRITKLIIAEEELSFQKEEKSKRAAKLVIADAEKAKRSAELVIANIRKAKRSAELVIANIEKAKRSAELVIANKELVYQKSEKAKRSAELVIAKVAKAKRSAELVIANIEKAKRAAEFVVVSKELVLSQEKEKLIEELTIVNEELSHQIEKGKQTELALQESNDKYSKAFQSSPYSITITTLKDGRFMEVNDAFVSISGFSRKEALSNSVLGTTIWVDKEERNSVISALRSGKDVKGKEFQFSKKNGEIMTGLFSAKIIHVNNEPFMISSIDDITERRKDENLLKESEQKSMSIMENSADAIFITNQQGKYLYTNKAVTAMLGYTSEEMKSKTIADLSPPNKTEEATQFYKQLLNEGKCFIEIELLKKDGSYISTDLNTVVLPDGTLYGSCRDITERKKAESELIKAKEKAEESDRLKSAFLTNMSHEIRTPMNGILGFAALLKDPNISSDDQQDFIQTIQISGARLLNTINSIVDISKIESGLTGVNIKETNINEKIEFTHKFFKQEVEIKGLQFLFKNGLPTNEAIIKTDNEKVYAILTNLVRNAIKFTYEGSVIFGYEKKGEYLEFFVKDTGIGIPQRQRQMIFERFRQGSESHNRDYEGNGLGLSIAKSYVEMLGGKIWVESEECLGSTFYFTIPYNMVSEEKAGIINARSAEHKEVQLENLKILIVEDDEISYSLLSKTLQKISKEVLNAITGVEAVEACRNNPDLDLVLMDIRMPQMDGLEATRRIRQFNKDVIIIAQTAYAFSGDKEKAIESGCNDYISKPINKTLLYELIKKYINK